MRTIGSHLNLPIVADLQKDDYKIIQLPAINNVKRRKMQNPKCEAYAINFKNDIQKYITKFNFSFKNFIGIILYADDITVSQPLGPFRRNNSFTHVAYRLSNAIELTSSELIHFRTYGVAQTKFAKFDHYQTLIRETIMDINTTEIKTQHGIMKVKVELVIGDNQFMHYLFKTPLIFTNRGRNNCRCCTISGTDWHKYKTAQSILPHVRKQHTISFLPENNHLNMDGFHDIIGGCLNYFLSGSISIFLKLLKNNFTEQQLINAILNNAFEFDKENELRTLLRPGFFKINKKDHFKNKTNVSGSECLLIAHCFWIILKEQINETQNESIKHKFKEIEILIKACLNLGYAINDYKLDIEECAVIFEKNAKAVYETMFLLFENYKCFLACLTQLDLKALTEELKISYAIQCVV
uniref:Reverse transcriptase domain-containing protein n=1 Tax=Strongyloides papillosus TaxID=174720 RepID=A0A0N5BD48_STREA